jgi:hypothetical protein
MSNYVQTTFFTPKDSLPPSNPAKTIFGAAYDVEFGNISTAIGSKLDASSIAAGPIAFSLGTTALPGITFLTQTGTGWSSDASGDLIGSTSGITRITVSGVDGGIQIGAPTGGDKGVGTINAASLFVNGVSVVVGSTGTFPGTLTGLSSGGTGTVNYVVTGGHVMMYITASITGTSNTGTMTMTGLPVAVQPTNTTVVPCAKLDIGSTVTNAAGTASITGGTITFAVSQTTGTVVTYDNVFTASGTKGLGAGWCISYPLI